MDKNKIYTIVETQVTQLNETLPLDQQFVVNKNTILFGNGSSIDSLSLVSVIVDLEARLQNVIELLSEKQEELKEDGNRIVAAAD